MYCQILIGNSSWQFLLCMKEFNPQADGYATDLNLFGLLEFNNVSLLFLSIFLNFPPFLRATYCIILGFSLPSLSLGQAPSRHTSVFRLKFLYSIMRVSAPQQQINSFYSQNCYL